MYGNRRVRATVLPWRSSKYDYSECGSVSVVAQHAKRMRHVIFSSVAYVAVLYFPT